MTDNTRFEAARCRIRANHPLIHCITNYVAMEFNADALLAVGASPLMSFCEDEMEELCSSSDALVVNIGCIDRIQLEAMVLAARAMKTLGKPWVLDPAGAGASRFRTDSASMLARELHPSVIRGNASEIMAMAGELSRVRGVDSGDNAFEALDAAKSLARNYGSVVSVSGETDIITDGVKVESVSGGNEMMTRITAMGCTATALTGAFLAVCDDRFEAAVFAMMLMARAGGKAASVSKGPGSMRVDFIDALSETV